MGAVEAGIKKIIIHETVEKYGLEEAQYLMEAMKEWTGHYTHGVLIDYDFTKVLKLREQVEQVCANRGWQFTELAGDLGLLGRWLGGEWSDSEFLTVLPGQTVEPSYDAGVIRSDHHRPPTASSQ